MKLEFFALLPLLFSTAQLSSNFIYTKDPIDQSFYRDVVMKISQNSSTEREGRIIGGDVAVAGQFPYAVGLHMRQRLTVFVCGGSLIKFNWVLTVRK